MSGTTGAATPNRSMGGMVVSGLDAWYGQAQALRGISLEVREREVVGLFGPNGAGKSTLLRSMARLHRQTAGGISFGGQSLERMLPDRVARLGVRLVREGSRVFDTMSVEDQLLLGARLAKRDDQEVLEETYRLFPVLKDRRREMGGYLSGGQRQMLALATALAGDPVCLLLDEPSTGLAHVIVDQLYATLRILAERGVALLIVEQTAERLLELATRGYLLETGEIRAEGRSERLRELTSGARR
jgi:branched-chain amino acid transport system ATP-binding protein